jgi:hypothetical protein
MASAVRRLPTTDDERDCGPGERLHERWSWLLAGLD